MGPHDKTKSILERIMEERGLNKAVIGLNLDEGKHEDLGLTKIISGNDIRIRHKMDQLGPRVFRAQWSIGENNGNFVP